MLTKKQKKEFEYKCKSFKKKNKDLLISISPLRGHLVGEWEWIDKDIRFFCNNDGFREEKEKYSDRRTFYQKDFEDAMTSILLCDKMIKEGDIEYLNERAERLKDLKMLLGCTNNEIKFEFINSIINKSGLSDNTIFIIKMAIYSALEEYDEFGTKLSKLCIDNETKGIYGATEELDLLLEDKLLNDEKTADNQMMKFELEMIREHMEKTEPIRLYRGFSIDKDKTKERVRQGYKADGEKYFKQDAGSGISYSLCRNVAGYFAMRKIMMKDGRFIQESNFYGGHITAQTKKFQIGNLVSREKYIEARAKDISSMRDERGLRPIICEYLLEPEQLKGFYLNLAESEIMSLPEDVVVKHYEIPTSIDIATCEYEWANKGLRQLAGIKGGLIDGGIICWCNADKYGKQYASFAKVEDIKDYANDFVDEYFNRPNESMAFGRFEGAMEKYAIALPEDIEPKNKWITQELLNYLRKPFDVVIEAGKKYRIGTIEKGT